MRSKFFNVTMLFVLIVLLQSCSRKKTRGWQCETYYIDSLYQVTQLSTEIFRADQSNWTDYYAAVIDARIRQRTKANTDLVHLLADSVSCADGYFRSSEFN